MGCNMQRTSACAEAHSLHSSCQLQPIKTHSIIRSTGSHVPGSNKGPTENQSIAKGSLMLHDMVALHVQAAAAHAEADGLADAGRHNEAEAAAAAAQRWLRRAAQAAQ